MEARLGIYVLRHKDKKPAGGVEELEAYFKCALKSIYEFW